MPKLIRARDNRNAPIVQPGRGDLTLSYFNLLRLKCGETFTVDVPTCELVAVVLSGRVDIAAGAQEYRAVCPYNSRLCCVWPVRAGTHALRGRVTATLLAR